MIRDSRILAAEFEWDEEKSSRNKEIRGFDFAFATGLFDNPVLESVQTQRDYGELRIKAIGTIENECVVVIYTPRGGKRRLISARPAIRKERNDYRSTHPS
jgi:uncharacterized DUF497 family protein